MKELDLNKSKIDNDGSYRLLADNSTALQGIEVYFRNLENILIGHIKKADMVVGCVAWLTNEEILYALSQVRDGVAIVVQKEDFLREDIKKYNNWRERLGILYDNLKCAPERFTMGGLVGQLSCCSDPVMDPIRCVGNHNKDKTPAFPRMHHKFLVFCKTSIKKGEYQIKPYAVWTGSFNLTHNASMSLENAVYLTHKEIVRAYYDEWQQIEAISEQLNWQSEWMAPEWRIGT